MENSAGLLSTAQWIALGTYKWIEAHAKTGASPVYRYRFDTAPPRAGEDYERDPNNPNWTVPEKITPNTLAYHSAEIEFVFGALPSKTAEPWRPSDYALSNLMRTYWTNFAKSSNPNTPVTTIPTEQEAKATPDPTKPVESALPNWPLYTDDSHPVMHLDATPAAKPDQHHTQYEFLATHPTPPTE